MSTFRSSASNTLGVHVGPIDKPRHKINLEDLERAAAMPRRESETTAARMERAQGRCTEQCPLWKVGGSAPMVVGLSQGQALMDVPVKGGKQCELERFHGNNVLCEASRANLSGAGSHHAADRPVDPERALAPAAAPPPPCAAERGPPGLTRGSFPPVARAGVVTHADTASARVERDLERVLHVLLEQPAVRVPPDVAGLSRALDAGERMLRARLAQLPLTTPDTPSELRRLDAVETALRRIDLARVALRTRAGAPAYAHEQ